MSITAHACSAAPLWSCCSGSVIFSSILTARHLFHSPLTAKLLIKACVPHDAPLGYCAARSALQSTTGSGSVCRTCTLYGRSSQSSQSPHRPAVRWAAPARQTRGRGDDSTRCFPTSSSCHTGLRQTNRETALVPLSPGAAARCSRGSKAGVASGGGRNALLHPSPEPSTLEPAGVSRGQGRGGHQIDPWHHPMTSRRRDSHFDDTPF